MRYLVITLSLLFSLHAAAQQSAGKGSGILNNPLKYRVVSGLIQDSTGQLIVGANLKLKSEKDSILTTSDKDGIFIFKDVRMASFVLTVSEVGYKTIVRKYLNNDQSAQIVLEPIILSNQSFELKQVTISGAPSIKYKTDTVEYRASDYKVPPYAAVDELLKKMEGIEVGADGSLTHQGQSVVRAKLNGREFGGGNVAQAIQTLPASIVDKIQIIEDYGDQAARTGIKDGPARKVLNITTRNDKSVGTIARLVSQQGNNGRYNEQAAIQNINANRVLNFTGNLVSSVNGIASASTTSVSMPASGGSLPSTGLLSANPSTGPGKTHSGSPLLSYTDNWGSKFVATGSYAYAYNNTAAESQSYGQLFSSRGSTNFNNQSSTVNKYRNHAFKFQLEYNINKTNFIQLNSTFNHRDASLNSNMLNDNSNYFTTGFEHPVAELRTNQPTKNNDYGFTTLYVHVFQKPKRNFSLQLGLNRTESVLNGDKFADYRYYQDSTQHNLIKDSVSHLQTYKKSVNRIYRSAITYVEPIGFRSLLEFTAQVKNSVHDNKAVSDTVLAGGVLKELTRLSNIYRFSFTETRVTIDYRFTGQKSNLSAGLAVVPTNLSGNQVDNNINQYVHTSRFNLRVVPVFRYAYVWSSTERFEMAYTGTVNEPDFQQLQPFTDRSDPNNIIIGNPDLKPSFMHNVTVNYNVYFPNNRFNISVRLDGALFDNQIATDITQKTIAISNAANRTINEISFTNVNGDRAINGSYNISKQLNDRKFYLTLNGNVGYNYMNAISNNHPYHSASWTFIERFGPQISLNNSKLLINPHIGFETDKSVVNTLNAGVSTIQTIKLAVDGKIFLPSNLQIHYDASKNYISGFSNYKLNPFVINAGMEIRVLKARNLALTFDVFDLLHQNNFIQQSVTPQFTSYTLSNTLSRYMLFGIKLNLQKWGGSPTRKGKPLKRRGDGSFYYE